jgi:hypothetical protein
MHFEVKSVLAEEAVAKVIAELQTRATTPG